MDNTAQVDYWNGPAGERWATDADQLDEMLAPFVEPVLVAADIQSGHRVLDVGCGSGALSRAALETGSHAVTGVDVSAPMLSLARMRTAPGDRVSFIEADASAWTADHPFDRLISRFGVMFFDAPETAFVNLLNQVVPGGKLAFACWQPLHLNEWASAPMSAALPLLKQPPPPPEPGAPGPFAFEDANKTTAMLSRAGWKEAAATSWTGNIAVPGGDIRGTAEFMTKIGPMARLIKEQGIAPGRVLDRLVERLESHADANGRVHMPAAVWIITAERGAG